MLAGLEVAVLELAVVAMSIVSKEIERRRGTGVSRQEKSLSLATRWKLLRPITL